ncbi:MAG TPA: FAD:protein FMN transferase [Anaerolineaceae bacterium]|nr:FAD:protein FMN transferase [Anaerolineaceae bacterium]HPN51356.1 FAD:protein FMN transferase [Anaerolineaceae bacterium]
MQYDAFRAMNTSILLAAEGDPASLAEGFRQTRTFIQRQEARFTRFSASSELCALNLSAGKWFKASPELFEVVSLARRYHEETGGLFNPAILPLLEEAGYDRSMDDLREGLPPHRAMGEPGSYVMNFGPVELDGDRQAVHLPAGMRIDLGGIAKGWIAEQAARYFSTFASNCVVDAGGDFHFCGRPLQGSWQVAVEDPFVSEHTLAMLNIESGGVATSTTTHRRWRQNGQNQHHLIDPRTGFPAHSPWVSVTAIADHTARAEALAKAMLIAGPKGAAWLSGRHPDAAFIAVDTRGRLWGSENARSYLCDAEKSRRIA